MKILDKLTKRIVSAVMLLSICAALISCGNFTQDGESRHIDTASIRARLYDLYMQQPDSGGYEQYLVNNKGNMYAGEDLYIAAEETLISDMDDDRAEYAVDIPESAWYMLSFEYKPTGNGLLPTSISLRIDDEFPFAECSALQANNMWGGTPFPLDRYGNECVAMPERLSFWGTSYIRSVNGRYGEPMLLYLEQGERRLSFSCEEGAVIMGGLHFSAPTATTIPADMTGHGTSDPALSGSRYIIIEAENMTIRNTPNIRTAAEYNVAVTPVSATMRHQNVIDETSFKQGGSLVEYDFDIPADGYYNIKFNYRQVTKSDFPVFRRLYIDGAVPGAAFDDLRFDYSRNFSEKEAPPIYLTAGRHRLGLEVSLDNIRYAVMIIEQIISEITDLAMQLSDITGGNTDRFRDFRLDSFGLDVETELLRWADTLLEVYSNLSELSGSTRPGTLAPIQVAESLLRVLAREPNDLPKRLNELAYSASSVRHYLVTVLEQLQFSELGLDKIVLYQQDAELPHSPNVFEAISFNTRRFFNSFTSDEYRPASSGESENLQVWMVWPRQYVEILQAMADTGFTPETGITVDFSISPDQQKLILANASGKAPDVALGVNAAGVYDLALRGALTDMRGFNTFKEVGRRFAPGMLIFGVCDDGVYALPETFNFWVLYYRKDILETLELEVPDSMDEVHAMLPKLRRHGMSFNSHVSNFVPGKTYATFMPFIYQNGGDLFLDGTSAGTGQTYGYSLDLALDTPETLAGLEMLTENYTIYGLEFEIRSFFQYFRDGRTPIGVSDYSTFNLLTNAAPELFGKWGVALYPGLRDENGDVTRYTSGAAESSIIFSSGNKQEQAWQFLEWWSSADVQTEFAFRLQSTLGNEFMWNPANLEAMGNAPWSRESRDIIVEQLSWTREPPRVPGGYMIERELSNAINSIVLEGRSTRSALDNANKLITREINRKLEDFGYTSDGEFVRPFIPADIELIEKWLQ